MERSSPVPPLLVEHNYDLFWAVHREFYRAEKLLKTAEWSDGQLDIPSINELRYVSFHLLRALSTGDGQEQAEELQRAKRHCQRASYDAIELSLVYELEAIMRFEEDFRLFPYTKYYPDILESMERIEEIKTILGEDREHSETRGENYERAEQHLEEIKEINRKLKVRRTEINKIIDQEKTDQKRSRRQLFWAGATALILLGGNILQAFLYVSGNSS